MSAVIADVEASESVVRPVTSSVEENVPDVPVIAPRLATDENSVFAVRADEDAFVFVRFTIVALVPKILAEVIPVADSLISTV